MAKLLEILVIMTVETAENLISSSRPRLTLFRGPLLVLLGLSLFMGALLAEPNLLGGQGLLTWLLPQVILVTMIAIIASNVIRQRRQGRLMQEAFEVVQLRQWPEAKDLLQKLLSKPIRHSASRTEALLALASVAEAEHAYETAQRIYETIVAEGVSEGIQLHTTGVALATVMFRTGQTADAVNLTDRLVRAELPEPLMAQAELVALFRELVMGQTQEGLERAEKRRDLFRKHLSTEAGYGYGLLAAAFDRGNQPEKARLYWSDATLLVRPADLLHRFSEMAPVAAKYPATEYPL